ncbi:MAG TPA: 3-oxoacyl-ACP reductase, partial [Roseovarius nubinhibens]|nr:3-oxoacyl-ACP reductase [Roseovarius nubinhibens]
MNQKIALITGAGSGVGLACAHRLAKDGFTLVLTGRQQDKIDAACATLDGQGHIAVAADVGVEAEVDALFERVETTFGRLDLLFNNAGRNGPAV